MSQEIRAVALYLPQFHPIPENDAWWGKGFTDWTNVVKAKPLFRGHYQPHIPADLGFYDLRIPQVREQQAQLASSYGIDGFCYYHYWFNGRQVLERPFREVFETDKPDFPFMLCWANENWTRVWDGGENHVLLEQTYSEEDDLRHIHFLFPYFADERYIKVEGKPVFVIYRPSFFPDIKKTVSVWRSEAAKKGIELYLCYFESSSEKKHDPVNMGFDASIQFPPFGATDDDYHIPANDTAFLRIKNSIKHRWENIYSKILPEVDYIDYDALIKNDLENFPPGYKQYPAVTPMWDNTARRKYPTIIKKSTPKKFGAWCKEKLSIFKPFSKEENFFFINAWNEWAEGNHLEPCQKWGHAYLEEFKNAMETVMIKKKIFGE